MNEIKITKFIKNMNKIFSEPDVYIKDSNVFTHTNNQSYKIPLDDVNDIAELKDKNELLEIIKKYNYDRD